MKLGIHWIWRFCVFLSVISFVGCGEKNWATVSGTVTLNGAPIGPGTIMFEPSGSADPRARSGIGNFAEDGRYTVRSAGGRDGLPAGEYIVIINGTTSGDEQIDPSQTSKIPPKYLNPNTSGLMASLQAGDNAVDFDLKP